MKSKARLIESLLKRVGEKYEKHEDFEKEAGALRKILIAIYDRLNKRYEFIGPLGVGGAGVVLHLKDRELNLDRALKFPRPTTEDIIDSVKNEIETMNRIRHDHLIALHQLGEVPIDKAQHPFFVMDFVKGADFRKWLLSWLDESSKALADGSRSLEKCSEITQLTANFFLQIGRAIAFLHGNGIIHFDIKPANILIAGQKALLSDLGFAKSRSDEKLRVPVGFTLFYAHPDLRHEYNRMSDKNRVRKLMSPSEFKEIWDIHAFGRALLEALALIDRAFPETVMYDYTFVYLHLAACRMLDGRNLTDQEVEEIRGEQGADLSVYREGWLELEKKDLGEIKYDSFSQIVSDLEKLGNTGAFQDAIPEINPFLPKRLQVSDGNPAAFTSRLKKIVEHPIFERLSSILQLGLVNQIYPTATHNRLQHSLGAFRNACLYVQALFNDPYNPLFRQLATVEDVKAVLLTSLLHDLGHFPLAHEIEETIRGLRHENLTIELLESGAKDTAGRTLKEIIENKDWGWGVEISRIKRLMRGRRERTDLFTSTDLKTRMLSSLIDGPIDVDKLDYLTRDSRTSGLRYADAIDIDRLVRNLTIVVTKYEDSTDFAVGTYEKGQSAAESLTFARYLLYQSLYWHHTARSIRAMLREALRGMPATEKDNNKFISDIGQLVGLGAPPKHYAAEKVLHLVEKRTNAIGIELLSLIHLRKYYKRIYSLHRETSLEVGKKSELEKFRECCAKQDFQEKLQAKILEKLTSLRSATMPRSSVQSPERVDFVAKELLKPMRILCDAPSPSQGATHPLKFIPEPERLRKNHRTRLKAGERVSEVWQHVHYTLMDIAAKGRIFCHPDIRDTLMAALGPDHIHSAVQAAIKQVL